jgi:hypothetical protein
MKKRYILFALVISCISLKAQTLTADDVKIGDTVTSYYQDKLYTGVILAKIDDNSCTVKWDNGKTNTSYYRAIKLKRMETSKVAGSASSEKYTPLSKYLAASKKDPTNKDYIINSAPIQVTKRYQAADLRFCISLSSINSVISLVLTTDCEKDYKISPGAKLTLMFDKDSINLLTPKAQEVQFVMYGRYTMSFTYPIDSNRVKRLSLHPLKELIVQTTDGTLDETNINADNELIPMAKAFMKEFTVRSKTW